MLEKKAVTTGNGLTGNM